MKRKRLDRDLWTTITKKRYLQTQVHTVFQGLAALLFIDEVSTPSRWDYPDRTITVCDAGMKWLQIIPDHENYMITAMISPENAINLWYIDVLAGYGFDTDGVAYYDDLYLDVIVRPNGEIKIDDMDELTQAFAGRIISKELFDLALSTTEKLQGSVLNDLSTFNGRCTTLLLEIEEQYSRDGVDNR